MHVRVISPQSLPKVIVDANNLRKEAGVTPASFLNARIKCEVLPIRISWKYYQYLR